MAWRAFVSPWMQAELERTEEEEAEHRAKQKEKAQLRSDDLARCFAAPSDKSTPPSTEANSAATNAKPAKPKGKAGKPGNNY